MDTTLLVMAAGMGSRFGGLKQLEPIGPNGEAILDFSIHDAYKAGFKKVVFIIKPDMKSAFENAFGKRWKDKIEISYAYQTFDNIPDWYKHLSEREKPFGTGHALLCAKDEVKTPFAVINADDYYGRDSFETLNKFLTENPKELCMVGFILKNTLSENGSVSRGICKTDISGFLTGVDEHTKITKTSGEDLNSIVSMNMWGLTPDLFEELESEFNLFLKNIKDYKKEEFFLPSFINTLIKRDGKKVTVLKTDEKWYGITYKSDTDTVKAALNKYIDEGKYDEL